ncbi:hypothetical protein E5F05_21000 [Deinococcus metallilatus]|uniref:Uncharacterized protein n=2 Tax=Deinococcus TaxID=1298 RepID=A0AAJ5JZ65_9DEIO|nr:hypothetical protein [Deinococcus metallilatus]MBB5294453.1 hypothetical protein [Deinococcus metallilatus]QBY10198.1 hypothetical protein E5F05_21000 [Deinococcus metallilatus]RXJ13924.1 hypothetical protein ERJ73_04650 [Deinococcus metallilatus]TLK29889.1 hypothetical protein FCS05_04965 [Deinococcus metallilatus]GMA15669.1 hypothetical protein GCM10025871_20000 [Deinococcus metallilatus]
MKPDFLRPLLGLLGLAIGFGVYPLAERAPQPWPGVLIGAMFVLLGVGAWLYARGERWIQVLGAALLVYGLLRMFLIR